MPIMPQYRSPYGQSIMELLSRQGDAQAQAAMMKGRIWGDAVQNIGQIGAQAYQQRAEQKDTKKREEMFNAAVGSWDGKDSMSLYRSLAPALGPKDAIQVARGFAAIVESQQKGAPDPKLFGAKVGALKSLKDKMGDDWMARNWGQIAPNIAGDVKAFMGVDLGSEWNPEYAGQVDALAASFTEQKAPGAPERVEQNGVWYERQPDGKWAQAAGLPTEVPDAKALPTENINGRVMQFNPATKRFDIDLGKSEAALNREAASATRATTAADKAADRGEEVSAWVASIASGDYTVDKVPPTIKSDVMVEAQKRGLDTRTLAQRDLDAGAEQTIESLKQLREQATKTMTADTGPGAKFQGVAQGALNYVGLAPETRKWEMQQAKLSMLARQMGEKGVLTDRDVDRVIGMLPKLTDPDHIRDRALNDIEEVIFTGLRGKVSNRVKVPGGAEAAAPGGVVEWEKGPDGKPRRKQGA